MLSDRLLATTLADYTLPPLGSEANAPIPCPLSPIAPPMSPITPPVSPALSFAADMRLETLPPLDVSLDNSADRKETLVANEGMYPGQFVSAGKNANSTVGKDSKRKASLETNRPAAAKRRINKKEKTEMLQRDSHDKAVHNAFPKDQVMRMQEEIQQMNKN